MAGITSDPRAREQDEEGDRNDHDQHPGDRRTQARQQVGDFGGRAAHQHRGARGRWLGADRGDETAGAMVLRIQPVVDRTKAVATAW